MWKRYKLCASTHAKHATEIETEQGTRLWRVNIFGIEKNGAWYKSLCRVSIITLLYYWIIHFL